MNNKGWYVFSQRLGPYANKIHITNVLNKSLIDVFFTNSVIYCVLVVYRDVILQCIYGKTYFFRFNIQI